MVAPCLISKSATSEYPEGIKWHMDSVLYFITWICRNIPLLIASKNGVFCALSCTSIVAPCLISRSAVANWSFIAAKCRALFPLYWIKIKIRKKWYFKWTRAMVSDLLSNLLISAPFFNNSSTTLICPVQAASCSLVKWRSLYVIYNNKKYWNLPASWSGVLPSLSAQLTLIPLLINMSAIRSTPESFTLQNVNCCYEYICYPTMVMYL